MQNDDVFLGVPSSAVELKYIDMQTKTDRLTGLYEKIDKNSAEKKALATELSQKLSKLNVLISRLFDDLNNKSFEASKKKAVNDTTVDDVEKKLKLRR